MRLTIVCNRTNALLCLAILASFWTILYFHLSQKNERAVFPHSHGQQEPIGVASAIKVRVKTPAVDKAPPGGGGDFLLKPSLSGATVVTRSATDWSRDDGTCEGDQNFVRTVLHSAAGDLPIFVHPKKMDVWVSGNILDGRVWEQEHVKRFHDVVKQDGDLEFVDIGGNIGVYGLTIAKLGRKVLFVEPLLKNIQKLCSSVRAGKYTDVYVIHNALSSTRFKVGFGTYEGNVGGTYVKNTTSETGETAQAVLLDDILEVFKLKKVAIKLDVETHEAKVLLGGDNFFKSVDVRYLQLEWGPHKKDPDGREIINFLTAHFMKPYHPATGQLLDTKDYSAWPGDIFWKKTT
ncbi:uncharacterized protein [Haliotis cracherodii]|uniref:uncharacterized protein n=1 Tax=Haliotis cracherodii TaxID=6455 RepID=UPI0039EC1B5C